MEYGVPKPLPMPIPPPVVKIEKPVPVYGPPTTTTPKPVVSLNELYFKIMFMAIVYKNIELKTNI